MKTIVHFIFFSFLSFQLCAMHEGKVESFKNPQEIDTFSREIENMSQDAKEKEAENFLKQFEKTEKEIGDREEYDEVTKELNKRAIAEPALRNELYEEVGKRQGKLLAYEEAKKLIEGKDEIGVLLQKTQERLAQAYERPIVEPEKSIETEIPSEEAEKLPFGKRMLEAIKKWVERVRASISQWFGNSKKVKTVTQNLESIGKNLDVIDKEKIAEFTEAVGILRKNILDNAEALKKLPANATQEQKETLVENMVNAVLQAESIVEQFDPSADRTRILGDIASIKESFRMSLADSQAIKNEATQARTKDITSAREEIRKSIDTIEKMSQEERIAFTKKVDQLGEKDLSVLPLDERALTHVILSQAYGDIIASALKDVMNKKKPEDVRDKAVGEVLNIGRTVKAQFELQKSFGQLAEQEGKKEPEKKLNVVTREQVEQIEKELDKARKDVSTMIKNTKYTDAYNLLDQTIKKINQNIDVKDVSISKLEARMKALEKQLNLFQNFKVKGVASRTAGKIADTFIKILDTIQKIVLDRSAMIQSDEQDKPVIESVVPAPPPPPSPELEEQQKKSEELREKAAEGTIQLTDADEVKNEVREARGAEILAGYEPKDILEIMAEKIAKLDAKGLIPTGEEATEEEEGWEGWEETGPPG